MDRLRIRRREFLWGAGLAVGSLAAPLRVRADGYALPPEARAALERSGFVYVSPLRASGAESRCHGEVWFFFDRGDAVIATGSDTWKARALASGRDRARVWVGDYGRFGPGKDDYRQGPTFEAQAVRDEDPATFERLLGAFGTKYPDEWDSWEPRFRSGYESGSRIVIRYRPLRA